MYLEYTKSSRFIFSIMYQNNRSKRKNFIKISYLNTNKTQKSNDHHGY